MPQIFVATSTWYGEPGPRPDLAIETARLAKEQGYVLIVVDGNSYAGFRKEMEAYGAEFHVQAKPGMDAARLEALERAALKATGNDVIVWTEPEKASFVTSIDIAAEPIQKGRADMVIPNRQSMDSYPPLQQLTETAARKIVSTIVRDDWDEFFGPVLVNRTALEYFIEFKPERYGIDPGQIGWLRNHAPRLEVLAAPGLAVEVVALDYTHPKEQTAMETGQLAYQMRRVRQLNNLLPAMWAIAWQLGLTDQKPSKNLLL